MNDIDLRAAEWAALSDEQISAEQRTALENWLQKDSRHQGAYVRALAILAHTQRVAAGADVERLRPKIIPMVRRRMVLAGGVATGLAAAVVALIIWGGADSYYTGVGQSKVVALSDGSKLTLNTASRAKVDYNRNVRSVTLVRGEALFDVAKNPSWPFVVTAGKFRVQAVGTSFAVRITPQHPLEILVREGVVRIESSDPTQVILAQANEIAISALDHSIFKDALSRQEVARRLAWLQGQIYFKNQPLALVAAEFERYNDTKIVIEDPNIASITISGLYRANDPAGFSKAAAASLGLVAEVRSDGIHIARK